MPYTAEDCVPAYQHAFARKVKKLDPELYIFLKYKSQHLDTIPSVGQHIAPTHKRKRKPEREHTTPLDTEAPKKKGRKVRPQEVFHVPLYSIPLKIPSTPLVRA